jgi:hypothetical protein
VSLALHQVHQVLEMLHCPYDVIATCHQQVLLTLCVTAACLPAGVIPGGVIPGVTRGVTRAAAGSSGDTYAIAVQRNRRRRIRHLGSEGLR